MRRRYACLALSDAGLGFDAQTIFRCVLKRVPFGRWTSAATSSVVIGRTCTIDIGAPGRHVGSITHSISTGLPNWRSISEIAFHNARIISGVRHCDRWKRAGNGCSVTPPRAGSNSDATRLSPTRQERTRPSLRSTSTLSGSTVPCTTESPAPRCLDDEAIALSADRMGRERNAGAAGVNQPQHADAHRGFAKMLLLARPISQSARDKETAPGPAHGSKNRVCSNHPEIAFVLTGEACGRGIFAGGGTAYCNRQAHVAR